MKKDMMNILCCPTCKSSLELIVKKEHNDDIITGSLQCTHCKKTYPILDGIPNFIDENE
jgi:uncharacterized protein YbaR (Trm112 family)